MLHPIAARARQSAAVVVSWSGQDTPAAVTRPPRPTYIVIENPSPRAPQASISGRCSPRDSATWLAFQISGGRPDPGLKVSGYENSASPPWGRGKRIRAARAARHDSVA
jgi:hypothetical protein